MDQLFSKSLEHIRHYILTCIDEEAERDTPTSKENIDKLRNFITDVKSSERFYTVESTRQIQELYKSVVTDNFYHQLVHNGATYLIASMGREDYAQMTAELVEAIQSGFKHSAELNNTVKQTLGTICAQNPWLVFCILCRFVWFIQEAKESK